MPTTADRCAGSTTAGRARIRVAGYPACRDIMRRGQSSATGAGQRGHSGATPAGENHVSWPERRREDEVRNRAIYAALGVMLALPLASAAAQEGDKGYPNRPIHIVVPFPAGGPADLVSRVIAQK